MWSSDYDPYEPSDLDRVLTREADTAILAHEDPEAGVHGASPFPHFPGYVNTPDPSGGVWVGNVLIDARWAA